MINAWLSGQEGSSLNVSPTDSSQGRNNVLLAFGRNRITHLYSEISIDYLGCNIGLGSDYRRLIIERVVSSYPSDGYKVGRWIFFVKNELF